MDLCCDNFVVQQTDYWLASCEMYIPECTIYVYIRFCMENGPRRDYLLIRFNPPNCLFEKTPSSRTISCSPSSTYASASHHHFLWHASLRCERRIVWSIAIRRFFACGLYYFYLQNWFETIYITHDRKLLSE